nr:uncharacterized protein LOC131770343 [Pocillopora verrucosa]
MSPEIGPTPLPTYNAKMLPQVQGKCQPKCCPTWLYIIMHQCWVYAPVERLPFMAIFDGISLRTPGAHLMVTWLNHYNQGKYLPLNKRRSEDPCLVNDKPNHPSSNVTVTYYGSARKEKRKDKEGK